MGIDKLNNDTRVYTDIQGIEQLRGQLKSDPDKVKHEVAKQFESLFVQMAMRSMRDANKAFSSDLLSSNEMGMYEDMFDKQLSLSLSEKGFGLAEAIEKNIDNMSPSKQNLEEEIEKPTPYFMDAKVNYRINSEPLHSGYKQSIEPESKSSISFDSPKEFVQSLWNHAKQAATQIGAHPGVLLAQAALETDWGKKIIPHQNGSSHNLFNIKSDASWSSASATVPTYEEKNGVMVKENAKFRTYESFIDSFQDYAEMITGNSRYQHAVKNAGNPMAYLTSLQDAGYASDRDYANKIMGIFNSKQFKEYMYGLV